MNVSLENKRRGGPICLAIFLVLCLLLGKLNFFCLPVFAEDPQKELKEVIRNGFYDFRQSIDISHFGVKPDEMTALFSSIIKNDPYLFYVDSRLSFSYRPDDIVLSLKPTYRYSKEVTEAAWQYCREQIRKLAKKAEGTGLEKALFLHDEVLRLFSYDDDLKNDNIYDFLLTGQGTCQAYTLLYMALLQEVGIRSVFVASDSISHIWNLVLLDGKWYHADLTWDDSNSSEEISRRHFLCSDETAASRGHRDWYAAEPIICNSEIYKDYDFEALTHSRYPSGDLDHSGKVTLQDLLYLNSRQEGKYIELPLCFRCADLKPDGILDQSDLMLMRKKLLEEELTNVEK